MSFLTPVRCYTCRKVIKVNKFLNAIEKQVSENKLDESKDEFDIDFEQIFNETFQGKLLPCCKPRYLNIISNIEKENILVSYSTRN